jgi:hypothetical protein
MKLRILILALAVTLAFGAGAFALYVFPGRSESVRPPISCRGIQCEPTTGPSRCDRFWQLMADAQTDGAVRALEVYHPDHDCYPRGGTASGISGLPPLSLGNLPPLTLPPPLMLPTRTP